MKLYGHPASGHAYKVALALELAEMPYEYTWVDIERPCSERPREFQERSRFCEVPLLLIDGLALTQSGAILQYLAREHGAFGGMKHYQQASEWIIWEANRIGMAIPQLIHAQTEPAAVNEGAQSWLHKRLDIDRARLSDAVKNTPFILGDDLTIADIAVFGYVSRAPDYGIPLSEEIEGWIERIQHLPYFQSADSLLACKK